MNETVKKFRIGLGVTGGIAAYKAIEVLRLLQRAGCEVTVAMTRNATEFVQPLTFRALTDKYVLVDDYAEDNPDPIAHINFSQNIDLLLIVPATANILAKFANGIADDFLTSTYLAATAPVLVAPAMNTTMWENPATRRNVQRLKDDGVYFVEPVAGELACKTVGTGKLEDVENIAAQALLLLEKETRRLGDKETRRQGDSEARRQGDSETRRQGDADAAEKSKIQNPKSKIEMDLQGERLLITVGGTREALDPVRFISNHSSGKMGFAVAEAAIQRGAEVTAVCGVTTAAQPENITVIRAVSAAEMFQAVMNELPGKTIFIGAAAVSDYRPITAAAEKIKKGPEEFITIELEKTADILANVSRSRPEGLLVAGFAAESSDVAAYARAKMDNKNLDLVVANDITQPGAGFNSETNIATIFTKNSPDPIELPLMSKREMADKILDELVKIRRSA